MMRLADMPSVRALTIATVIHTSWRHDGRPSAARTMPEYAKGSAKMLSWNLTAPKNSGTLFISGKVATD